MLLLWRKSHQPEHCSFLSFMYHRVVSGTRQLDAKMTLLPEGGAFHRRNERSGSFDANGFVAQHSVISTIARYLYDPASSLSDQIRKRFTVAHIR